MRVYITSLFIFLALIQAYAKGYSQTLTMNLHDVNLLLALQEVSTKSGYDLVYSNNMLTSAKQVSIQVKNASIETVLDQLFIGQPLSYTLRKGTIIIQQKSQDPTQFSQQISLEGIVLNGNGEPLAGASIAIKGTNIITISGNNGHFSFKDIPPNAQLIVTYVGYKTQKINAYGQKFLNILLESEVGTLDEVVVGYAKQLKADVTGSVSSVPIKSVDGRSITSVSAALAGTTAGVFVSQSSGKPGSDGANIRIRGTGTLNNASPLVLVDGIIGNLDEVNPLDVASISILKDAAAASIYGAQAGNGVILVTTKQGKNGPAELQYSSIFSINNPVGVPDLISDYPTYMALVNQSAVNIGQTSRFPQSELDRWNTAKANPDGLNAYEIPNRVAYPNTNWNDVLFQHNLIQTHQLSVLGGGEKTEFNLSARYLHNPGLMDNTGLNRYEIRANVQTKIKNFLTIGTQTFASTQLTDKGKTDDVFSFLASTTPGAYPLYEGKYGGPESIYENPQLNNPFQTLSSAGGTNQTSRFNTTLFAKVDILKGLSIESKVNYQIRFQETSDYANPHDLWRFNDNSIVREAILASELTTSRGNNKDYRITFDNVVRYTPTLNEPHHLAVLVGHNEFYDHYYEFKAVKKGLIDNTITDIGSAAEMSSIDGSSNDRGLRSFFGRINYDFQNRYLFEANLRYDGSSRFGNDSRWGVFPSFSGGWLISSEKFFQGLRDKVQHLKLRASWGKLGNDAAGDYDHLSSYANVNYSFGGAVSNGLAQSKLANEALRWEETTLSDVGLEFNTFNSRLKVELDAYNRITSGILTTYDGYLTSGTVEQPTVNGATVSNRGFELGMNWNGAIKELSYSLGINMAYNHNQVTHYKGQLEEGWQNNGSGSEIYTSNLGEVSAGTLKRTLEGHLIDELYVLNLYHGNGKYYNQNGSVNPAGGPAGGMIRTNDDLAWVQAMQAAGYVFAPVNGVGPSQLYYGDFIYADKNGDGIYGNSYDYGFTGKNDQPNLTLGFNAAFTFKGFDLSMLWAGAFGQQLYWNASAYNTTIINNGTGISNRIAANHYYFNQQDLTDASNNQQGVFPRLKFLTDNINQVNNNFWLYNGSYLKLKNLQLGYTFPETLIKKGTIHAVRIFLTGENLLLFSPYPGIDPELGASIQYPSMRQFAMGIQIKL
ncbi:TonB-linked outer membrane protein, SusC/RagA family [bacterium A37T11]|nr:TonB-linked outer membrane protein, SusC/RagA family [bacterium A37T11]